MKLGSQDLKLFVGDTEVLKAYIGGTLAYESTPAEEGLVQGASRIILPPESFTSAADHVYYAINDGETPLPYRLMGDGMIGFRFDTDSRGAFYITSSDGSSSYLGLSIDGGELKYVSNTGGGSGTPSTQPVAGDFAFLRRIAGVVTLDITDDLGVTWTNLVNFGTYAETYIVSEAYNLKKYADPQHIGLTNA